jgi:hypothetical protein
MRRQIVSAREDLSRPRPRARPSSSVIRPPLFPGTPFDAGSSTHPKDPEDWCDKARTKGARVCDPQQRSNARRLARDTTAPADGDCCGSQTRAPESRRGLKRLRLILTECGKAANRQPRTTDDYEDENHRRRQPQFGGILTEFNSQQQTRPTTPSASGASRLRTLKAAGTP